MTANEISQLVNNGRTSEELDRQEYAGHIGIMIAHAYLHNIPMEADVLSRYLKIDSKDIENPLSKMSGSGMFLPYNWLAKSRNSMLRIPAKKFDSCIAAWTHIAAIASGYIETLPNQRYISASPTFKLIQSA